VSAAHVVAVVPALDEEETIAAIVAAAAGAADEVVVVDNGSRDATGARAAAAGATVVREPRRGYGAACLSGSLAAPAGALLVFLDADGSDDPAALRRLARPVLDGRADLVLGSRVRGHREPGALAPHQLAANRVLAALIRARWRIPISDIGPMRAIRREALLALRMRSRTHGWPVEMLVKAARRGLRVEELPVDARPRAGGRSKVAGSLTGSLKAGVRLLAALVRYGLAPTR
jgi:glycosyltransferase involved in cell wall biosynthesis